MNTGSIPNLSLQQPFTEQLSEQIGTQTNELEPGRRSQLGESMQSNTSKLANNLVADAKTFTNAAPVLPVIFNDRAQNFATTAAWILRSTPSPVPHSPATGQLKNAGLLPIPHDIDIEQNPMSPSDAQSNRVGGDKNEQQENLRKISNTEETTQVAHVKAVLQQLVIKERECAKSVAQHMQDGNKAREAGQPVPKLSEKQWEALIESHKALLQDYYTFFEKCFVPGGTKKVRLAYEGCQIINRMFDYGFRKYLEVLEDHFEQDSVQKHADVFFTCLNDHLSALRDNIPGDKKLPKSEQVAPDLDIIWIASLGDTARRRLRFSKKNEHSYLIHTAVRYYNMAVARRPTNGRFFYSLYLVTSNSVERLGLFGKALSTAEPYLGARQNFLKSEIDTKQTNDLPLGAALARIQRALLSGCVVTHKDAGTFFEQFKRTMEEKSPEFRRLGPHLAVALLAGVVGFGAEDSDILRDLVPRNKDGTSRLASALPRPKQGTRTPLELANFLAFIAFKDAVNHFINAKPPAGSDVLPFVHCFMKFLQGTMSSAAGLAPACKLFANPNMVVMLNRIVEQQEEPARPLDKEAGGWEWSGPKRSYERALSSRLHVLALGHEIAAEQASFLPEDLTTFGAVWDASPPDSDIFTQVRKHLEGELRVIPELEPSPAQDHARRARILAIAVQLAKTYAWLDFDPQTSRFCVKDMGDKSDPNRIAN